MLKSIWKIYNGHQQTTQKINQTKTTTPQPDHSQSVESKTKEGFES